MSSNHKMLKNVSEDEGLEGTSKDNPISRLYE